MSSAAFFIGKVLKKSFPLSLLENVSQWLTATFPLFSIDSGFCLEYFLFHQYLLIVLHSPFYTKLLWISSNSISLNESVKIDCFSNENRRKKNISKFHGKHTVLRLSEMNWFFESLVCGCKIAPWMVLLLCASQICFCIAQKENAKTIRASMFLRVNFSW